MVHLCLPLAHREDARLPSLALPLALHPYYPLLQRVRRVGVRLPSPTLPRTLQPQSQLLIPGEQLEALGLLVLLIAVVYSETLLLPLLLPLLLRHQLQTGNTQRILFRECQLNQLQLQMNLQCLLMSAFIRTLLVAVVM
jgi:hypothetical protein